MNSASAHSRRGRRSRNRLEPISAINVTPFVDVMLVLLVVFMITAPLLTAGVPVDLPESQARQLSEAEEPLVLTLQRDGTLHLQETEINEAALIARLTAITAAKTDTRIYIRADAELAYGEVLRVMGKIQAGGFNRVALVSKPEPKP